MAAVGTMKIGDAAEKSPTVYYANLKEDMLLRKKLHVLNRSEKSFVHRIRIDQKVLYKRFQNKLHRSKLTEARMWGNKELERELRARNLHGLHSQNADSEEDYEFLKKLEKPKSSLTGKSKPKISIQHIDKLIEDVFQPEILSRRPRSRSFSDALPLKSSEIKTKALRPNTLDIPEISLAVRPSTSDGVRINERSVSNETNGGIVDKVKIKSQEATPKRFANFLDVPSIDRRAKTCSPQVSRKIESPLPVLASRRQSTVASPDKGKRKSASFFEPEKKIDLVELRLNEMKDLDYSDKIQEYYETLGSSINPDQENLDYYTLRLQLAMKEFEKHRPVSVPGTPETEYKRHMGNVKVKSLTFKKLNLDFSRQEHIAHDQNNSWPEPLPVLMSSDDESDGSLSD